MTSECGGKSLALDLLKAECLAVSIESTLTDIVEQVRRSSRMSKSWDYGACTECHYICFVAGVMNDTARQFTITNMGQAVDIDEIINALFRKCSAKRSSIPDLHASDWICT